MTQTFDVAVAFCAFRTEVVQGFFGVVRVTRYSSFNLFIDHNINLDALFCLALQNLV